MSTRAVIARQTNDGWQGVSSTQTATRPPWAASWSVLHHEHGGHVPVFLNAVINAHPGGWAHFAPAIPAELECGRNFERCHCAWAHLSGDDREG